MDSSNERQRVNPYAVTQAIDDQAIATPRLRDPSTMRFRVSFGLAVILYVGSLVSAAIACLDIESIVGSGPFMIGVAIAVLVATQRTTLTRLRYQACATIGFCISCFLIIWQLGLSPGRAQWPIGSLIVAFALLMNTQWPGWYAERRRIRSGEDAQS